MAKYAQSASALRELLGLGVRAASDECRARRDWLRSSLRNSSVEVSEFVRSVHGCLGCIEASLQSPMAHLNALAEICNRRKYPVSSIFEVFPSLES